MKKLNMKRNLSSGLLIAFCGMDGCGKTTLINRLVNDLKDENQIFLTKQPTQGVRNSEIFRNYMDTPNHTGYDYRSLSLLAASDRVQHTNNVILPALDEGEIVISDRYFYSCLANLRARGYKNDRWIYEVSKYIIKPDISFFFDVPVEVAVSRVIQRPEEKERYIDMELQYRLRKEYINICKANSGILISTEDPIEECYKKVLCEVKKCWRRKNEFK